MAPGFDSPSSPSSNSGKTRTCLCSPTSHPGSFQYTLHKNKSTRRKMADAAKELMLRAFLPQIINRSRKDVKRRTNFQPKPSRCHRQLHLHPLLFSRLSSDSGDSA
ncbi:hypothetical protein LINGRAHAP2_LOCUS30743, partial [Linum grandiflorum]